MRMSCKGKKEKPKSNQSILLAIYPRTGNNVKYFYYTWVAKTSELKTEIMHSPNVPLFTKWNPKLPLLSVYNLLHEFGRRVRSVLVVPYGVIM